MRLIKTMKDKQVSANRLTEVSTNFQRQEEHGFALVAALIILIVLGVISFTVLTFATAESRIASSDLNRTQAFYAAETKLEDMSYQFNKLFQSTSAPSATVLNGIATNTTPEIDTLFTSKGYSFAGSTLTIDPDRQAQFTSIFGAGQPFLRIPDGPYYGMSAAVIPYVGTATATDLGTGTRVTIRREFNSYLIPIFQFSIFSDTDVELDPGVFMSVSGRVHANKNIYALRNLLFTGNITTAGELVRDVKRSGIANTGTGNKSVEMIVKSPTSSCPSQICHVPMNFNSGGAFLGSVDGGPNWSGGAPGPGFHPGSPVGTPSSELIGGQLWKAASLLPPTSNYDPAHFNNQLLTNSNYQIQPLKLPLGVDDVTPVELIKRSLPGTDNTSISQARYENKAQIRILIDDEGISGINVAGIQSGGVDLDSFNPLPLSSNPLRRYDDSGNIYGPASINRVPLQKNSPTDTPPTDGTGDAQTVRSTRNNYTWATATPAEFSGGRLIPPGSGIKGHIKIEVVPACSPSPCTPGAPIDVTSRILSMGMTVGEPNGIVRLQRPLWAAFMQESRDRKSSGVMDLYEMQKEDLFNELGAGEGGKYNGFDSDGEMPPLDKIDFDSDIAPGNALGYITGGSPFTYLTDLNWITSPPPTQGIGTIQRDASIQGSKIHLYSGGNETFFDKGIGTHAFNNNTTPADVSYDISSHIYNAFQAKIGVDREVGGNGSVQFQVLIDGVNKYTSPVMHGYDSLIQIPNIPITNTENTLTLRVFNGGDGYNYDHADWADAKLISSSSAGSFLESDEAFNKQPTREAAPAAIPTGSITYPLNLNAIVPINVYNVREGWINDSQNPALVSKRGVTSVVDLNMRNLSRWLDGVYDGNLLAGCAACQSTNIHSDRGYVVYVSDRRGDQPKDEIVATSLGGSTIRTTNGSVDNEDVYFPPSSVSPDNALVPPFEAGAVSPEDVILDSVLTGTSGMNTGTLQKDTVPATGYLNTELPDNLITTVASWDASLPSTFDQRLLRAINVMSWDNSQPAEDYFRRSVRLSFGEKLATTCNSYSDSGSPTVRTWNCAANKLSANKGITVASENMVYIAGNYNTIGIGNGYGASSYTVGGSNLNSGKLTDYNGPQVPASIVCDAFSPLSKTWFDANSAMYPEGSSNPSSGPFGIGYRIADAGTTDSRYETAVRAALMFGTTISAMQATGGTAARNNAGLISSGGMHNAPRFLEQWAYSGSTWSGNHTWSFSGSMVTLFNSTQAFAPWENARAVTYTPPVRNWSFDSTFTDQNKLPPGTPFFQYVQSSGFQPVIENQ